MRISVSIMAHPDRTVRARALQGALGVPAPIGWDGEGAPSRDPDRIWRTARRAWELRDARGDWHLLLQDDAIVPAHLVPSLARALENVPACAVVSLYVGGGRPLSLQWRQLAARADAAGASWIVGPRPMWGVGLAIPTPLVPQMLAYGDRQHGIPDDMRTGRWARVNRLETWYTWPSLVDHPDGGSLTGHGSGRTARRFVGADAAEVDWSGPAVRWGSGR